MIECAVDDRERTGCATDMIEVRGEDYARTRVKKSEMGLVQIRQGGRARMPHAPPPAHRATPTVHGCPHTKPFSCWAAAWQYNCNTAIHALCLQNMLYITNHNAGVSRPADVCSAFLVFACPFVALQPSTIPQDASPSIAGHLPIRGPDMHCNRTKLRPR